MNALPLGDSKTTTYNMDETPSSINRFSYSDLGGDNLLGATKFTISF